jgi:hypothetical protein
VFVHLLFWTIQWALIGVFVGSLFGMVFGLIKQRNRESLDNS